MVAKLGIYSQLEAFLWRNDSAAAAAPMAAAPLVANGDAAAAASLCGNKVQSSANVAIIACVRANKSAKGNLLARSTVVLGA